MGDSVDTAKSSRTAGRIYLMRPTRRPAPPSPSKLTKIYGAAKKSPNSIKKWWNSPEAKHKKRVAKYQFYAAQGKVKASFKKGFRWVKKTCSKLGQIS